MSRLRLVSVRLSAVEYAGLVAAAEAALKAPSTFLRNLALASLGTSASTPLPLGPISPGRLTRKVSSRVTEAEAEMLGLQAKQCGLPVAAYVRCVLRGTTPSVRRTEAQAAVVALSRVGNNLNQLTRLAHGGRLIPGQLFRTLEDLRAEVYRLRKDILAAEEDRP